MKRLWISSMEEEAIREGVSQPAPPAADYDGLHQAALGRSKADWLVGISATRLFSVLYHRTLKRGARPVPNPGAHRPAGRRRSRPSSRNRSIQWCWGLLSFTASGGKGWTKRKPRRCRKPAWRQGSATVQSVERKEKSEKPPALYDLPPRSSGRPTAC